MKSKKIDVIIKWMNKQSYIILIILSYFVFYGGIKKYTHISLSMCIWVTDVFITSPLLCVCVCRFELNCSEDEGSSRQNTPL